MKKKENVKWVDLKYHLSSSSTAAGPTAAQKWGQLLALL